MRARIKDPMSGRMREIKKVLDVANEREAFSWLEDERSRVRAALGSALAPKQHFGDYAVMLFERKSKTRELRSPTARERWKHTLKHLIGGTQASDEGAFVPGFGELALDEIRVTHIERWREGIAGLVGEGAYSPRTANGWMSILRVILKAAARELELPRALHEQVRDFDVSDHVTYSAEAPQSLSPEQVAEFLALVRVHFPQHYAMTFLGFCTGLRPSSLRPLRRRGEAADVLWEEGRLLIRRSQTLGEEVLQTTKQRTRYTIDLPKEAIEVLRWHVETQLTEIQKDSDLLFPSVSGGFRSASILNKPFAEVSEMIGLKYDFTQIGLRRTFNDLARQAQVSDIITRSVSGHATAEMQRHYSSVAGEEQAKGLGQVVSLMTARSKAANDVTDVPGGAQGGAPSSQVVLFNKKPAAR